jgi:hypothetical protein
MTSGNAVPSTNGAKGLDYETVSKFRVFRFVSALRGSPSPPADCGWNPGGKEKGPALVAGPLDLIVTL